MVSFETWKMGMPYIEVIGYINSLYFISLQTWIFFIMKMIIIWKVSYSYTLHSFH